MLSGLLLVSCNFGESPPASDDSMSATGAVDPTSPSSDTASAPTGGGGASASASSTAGGQADETGPGTVDSSGGRPIFDVASGETGSEVECGCGESEWSYLWAANADQSAVSKLNTRTMVEEGRYPTHPEGDGNPSRTSVSVDARAVVVQNRDKPGLVKIWAREELCDPMRNGQPGLQTSTGPDDVLAFEDEDCIAWWVDFPGMTVQRPVQWTQGTQTTECDWVDQKIWTVTGDGGTPGHCGSDGVHVHRLDGDTGAIEDSIHVLEADFPCNNSRGAYGGAVDADGNFWFQGWQTGKLARVDFESLEVQVWDHDTDAYGITVDTQGRPWLTWPVTRFDPVLEVFEEVPIDAATGIAEDHEGRMWVSDGQDLIWIDRDTLAVGATIALPDGNLPQANMVRGIAVDVDGMVWGVRRLHTTAYRVDPDDPLTVDAYDQFTTAYTYSDMTGGQLQNVTCAPEG